MLKRIKNITLSIRKQIGEFHADIAVVIGSGIGGFIDAVEVKHTIKYSDIEGFPTSSVQGHKGEFVFGSIGSVNVIVMNGRVHYYEGYSMEDVVCGVRVMRMLGAKELYLTNAAGGINESFSIGDIMILSDHINLAPNPLIGANIAELGERFPSMTECYSARLRALAREACEASGIEHKEGIYLGLTGPSYETPAEIRYFRGIGADAVGMSTVPEAIAAHHAGFEVIVLSAITNLTFSDTPPTHKEVIEEGAKAATKVIEILSTVIKIRK